MSRHQFVIRWRRVTSIRLARPQAIKAYVDGSGTSDALGSRDLLTLLIKANMSPDIPESQRLSDEDVLARKFACSAVAPNLLTLCTERCRREYDNAPPSRLASERV